MSRNLDESAKSREGFLSYSCPLFEVRGLTAAVRSSTRRNPLSHSKPVCDAQDGEHVKRSFAK